MAIMTKRDYYEILGVSRTATLDEIKKAFRSHARNLHPDNKDSGDELAFKELAAAYEVLSDENKRALYDRYGHDGLSGGAGGFEGVDLGAFGLDEIFAQFFGGGSGGTGRRATRERGADLKYDLRIDFLEAVFGAEKKILIKHLEDCSICQGSGAAPGSKKVNCSTCAGQGQIRQSTATFLGHFTQILTCPNCRGEGSQIEKLCTNCKGKGQIRKEREITIKIPPGIDNGSRIRVTSAGDHGRHGTPSGDLYVIVHASEHLDFIRDGSDIHIKQKISFSLAALGGELLVPTVDGEQVLKIPAGTQSGAAMVLRQQGVPHLNNPSRRGDQIVHLIVETPAKLSSQERKLFEQLAELQGQKLAVPYAESGSKESTSFIGKITEAFRPKEDS